MFISRLHNNIRHLKPQYTTIHNPCFNREWILKRVQPYIPNLDTKTIYHNLDYKIIEQLYRKEHHTVILNTAYGKVRNIDTGIFTGRSPNDKYFVDSTDSIWSPPNIQLDPSIFKRLYKECLHHYDSLDTVYMFEGYCGYGKSRKQVQFITEFLWQHHFVKNMFIEKDPEDIYFKPDFTIINTCNVTNSQWKADNLHSENFVILNLDNKVGIIGGTHYGGEMKKGIFSLMNYWLPKEGVLPMHCSANIGPQGDSALFFGLSGTGKTTLSAVGNRQLIGDDEHGWDNKGIFNFEGGCYAKTIDLSEESEPEIVQAIKPGALLENTYFDEYNCPDYSNRTKTENGRVSYPLSHIKHLYGRQIATHPRHIIFLTCDAFGVLPPISRLTYQQAAYHFLSGYTAKVAGTERGVKEPTATFSACFGEAFLSLHPKIYMELLQAKLEKHKPRVWLVNTGWSGGGYGVGERLPIEVSRACVDAILGDSITEYEEFPYFDLEIPKSIPGISTEILNPTTTWEDKEAYKRSIKRLEALFRENYLKYE